MARSFHLLLGATAGLIALVPAAALAQQAPGRMLAWPGKPDDSAQPYSRPYGQGAVPPAAAHAGAYAYSSGPRPVFSQPAPVSPQPPARGPTPASAWTGGQPLYYGQRDAGTSSYGPAPSLYSPAPPSYDAPPPAAYASARPEPMPVYRAAPPPSYDAPPPVYRPVQPQPVQPQPVQPPIEADAQGYWQGPAQYEASAPVADYSLQPQPQPQPQPDPQPAGPAHDPMAPRRDAPIFNMGRPAQPAPPDPAPNAMAPQPPAAAPQAPSDQPLAYQPVPAAAGGARYYSVHRDAGRHPDRVAMPQPTVVTLMAGDESTATAPGSGGVDLAEPQAPPALIRDINGNLRAAPQGEDPSLP